MFSQTKFLNSSITAYTASGGYGDTPSQLSVSLIDDPANADLFTPGNVGRPVTFQFGRFTFTGILSAYHEDLSTGGLVYEATVVDPRDLLEGVQLILDGYTGSVFSIYNVLNVYGYLESFGFGASEKNETGIPWKYIRTAIHNLTQQTQQGIYGGPLYFIQSRYIVDLSLLPNLPDDFRVGSDSTSLLQYITEVCEAGGCDFFVVMTETTPGIFVIQVRTISRSMLINYGVIAQFLASVPQSEGKKIGFELQNETTSKFLVGGPVRDLWYQNQDGSVNTIWPFWGFDINGNPIIGEGTGDDHAFVLDSRSVANPRVGAFYYTNVAEMRSVLAGRASWETFLIFNKGNGGIHSNKAVKLDIVGYVDGDDPAEVIKKFVKNYQDNENKLKLDPGKVLFPHSGSSLHTYEQLEVETGYLYDFLFQIATEYYGKKFMVMIPFTYSAVEPDTGKIRTSRIPVDSGYLEEDQWPNAIQNNLLPLEVDRFTEEDGKIISFVRFNNGDFLDLSDLNPDSVAFNSRQPTFGANKLRNVSVFVKCSVEENITYLDNQTRFGPRAIITLDGVVRQRVLTNDVPGKELLIKFITEGFSNAKDANGKSLGIDTTTQDFNDNVIQKFIGYIGQDVFNYGNETSATSPDLAVIPLESQVDFYGPWQAVGGAGKVDYEKDDTLVPWNYGGWDVLNLTAYAKVNQAIGTNFQLEQGEITFPDVPFHNLGDPLLLGGPIVSDISVTIGTGGAHTTYKFRRNVKQPRYGQARAERVAQLGRRNQQIRRNLRLNQNPKRRAGLEQTKTPINILTRQDHPKVKKTSSHEVLAGQIFTNSSGNYDASVFLQSDYNFIGHVEHQYDEKSFMSLDGLLCPYSTVTQTGYPSFATPTGELPTVTDLNPFKEGHNIKLVSGGDVMPANLYDGADSYKPVGLRGPLVMTGWGYDIKGFPVPNLDDDGQSLSFKENYLTNMASWKTGPVDLRWDEERGVWNAGGSSTAIVEGHMKTALSPLGTGIMTIMDAGGLPTGDITVYDKANWTVRIGAYVIATKINGKYKLLVAEC